MARLQLPGDLSGLRYQEVSRSLSRPRVAPLLIDERAPMWPLLAELFVHERARSQRRRLWGLLISAISVAVAVGAASSSDGGSAVVAMMVAGGALLLAPVPSRRWSNLLALTRQMVDGLRNVEDLEPLLELAAAIGELPDGSAERDLLQSLQQSLARVLEFVPADYPLTARALELLVRLVDAGVREYVGFDAAPVALTDFLIAALLTLDSRGDRRVIRPAGVLFQAARAQRLRSAAWECLGEPGAPEPP